MILAGLLLGMFSTGSLAQAVSGSATLSVNSVDPPAESKVSRDSVIKAELRYSISNFYEPGFRYFVMAAFQNRAGGTFNTLDHPEQGVEIKKALGAVTITYPIAKEWDSPKLARPVTLSFLLVRVRGAEEPTVIAYTRDIVYSN